MTHPRITGREWRNVVLFAVITMLITTLHPSWRASALGVYRLWRDSGYAFGALLGGVVSDVLGIHLAVAAIAVLTALSGLVTFVLLPETATPKGILPSKSARQLGTAAEPTQSEPRLQEK